MAWRLLLAGIRVRARMHTHFQTHSNEQTEFSFHVPWARSPSIASFCLSPPAAVSTPAPLLVVLSPLLSSASSPVLSFSSVRQWSEYSGSASSYAFVYVTELYFSFFPSSEFYLPPATVSCWRTWCPVWTITCVCWPFLTTQSHH